MGVAVGIGDQGGAQPAIEKVMARAEGRPWPPELRHRRRRSRARFRSSALLLPDEGLQGPRHRDIALDMKRGFLAISRATLTRAGFRQEDHVRQYPCLEGKWRDHLLFAILWEDRRS